MGCYDSMPDSVEMAIGWVRTTARLTALKQGQTAVETAERILNEVAAQRRLNLPGGPQFTGYRQNTRRHGHARSRPGWRRSEPSGSR